MEKIKILLADDHLLIRHGIKVLLKNNKDFEIVAEATTGKEAIEYLTNSPGVIDVVLLDISMPEMNGIEATHFITNYIKNVKVLALTSHSEEKYISSMIEAGALGYILKELKIGDLETAIKTVAKGKQYYSNAVSVSIINTLMKNDTEKYSTLSKRELEVLGHIANGSTNKEVGDLLYISGRTVETHRRNILDKLDIKNTAKLILYAFENKLVA